MHEHQQVRITRHLDVIRQALKTKGITGTPFEGPGRVGWQHVRGAHVLQWYVDRRDRAQPEISLQCLSLLAVTQSTGDYWIAITFKMAPGVDTWVINGDTVVPAELEPVRLLALRYKHGADDPAVAQMWMHQLIDAYLLLLA